MATDVAHSEARIGRSPADRTSHGACALPFAHNEEVPRPLAAGPASATRGIRCKLHPESDALEDATAVELTTPSHWERRPSLATSRPSRGLPLHIRSLVACGPAAEIARQQQSRPAACRVRLR